MGGYKHESSNGCCTGVNVGYGYGCWVQKRWVELDKSKAMDVG